VELTTSGNTDDEKPADVGRGNIVCEPRNAIGEWGLGSLGRDVGIGPLGRGPRGELDFLSRLNVRGN
jgi:hypothetical protein